MCLCEIAKTCCIGVLQTEVVCKFVGGERERTRDDKGNIWFIVGGETRVLTRAVTRKPARGAHGHQRIRQRSKSFKTVRMKSIMINIS